jgi:hypothetical protein
MLTDTVGSCQLQTGAETCRCVGKRHRQKRGGEGRTGGPFSIALTLIMEHCKRDLFSLA